MSRRIRERVIPGLSLAGAAWLLALGCSSGGQGNGDEPVGCDPSVDPTCKAVGQSCQSNLECSSGSCSGGTCASVGPDGTGGSAPFGGGGFLVDDLGNPELPEDKTCVDLDVDFTRITPTVMLLIDQSGSMEEPFDKGRDRWTTLRETLTNRDGSFLKRLESSVRFGMTLYTSQGGFGKGSTARTCPILQKVGIQRGNFQNISDFLNEEKDGKYVQRPGGDTPTAESVEAVSAVLRSFEEPGPKSIILATDGDPDTCEDPDSNNREASKTRSVQAVRAAFGAGIPTHVISVGDEVTASHLEALAVAGAGGDQSAKAYKALDTSALEAAFETIIGSVRTCDFTLEGKVTAANAPRGNVVLDGQALSFGDANGWEMPNDQTVRLNGEACSRVQADAASVTMKFPCDAITILR